jgi:hypothetical protein
MQCGDGVDRRALVRIERTVCHEAVGDVARAIEAPGTECCQEF